MKAISYSGIILSILFLGFGLYLHFVVAPDAYAAESQEQTNFDALNREEVTDAQRDAYMQSAERKELFMSMDKKTDYGIYCMMGAILPFLLCVVAAIKKQKIAYLGLLLSIVAFFIGAAYGSHMFS